MKSFHMVHIMACPKSVTLREPVYEYIVPSFRPKISSFRLPYQHHSSSADCATELKPSKDSASLLVWLQRC